jgi:hypothetical protein
MGIHSGARAAPGVVLTLLALALAGCFDAPAPAPSPEQPRPVNEARQAERDALATLTSFCLDPPWRVRNRPARRPRRADAVAAIELWVRHAREDIREWPHDAEKNVGWRADLGSIAGELERLDCLLDQVPRLDRALRRLPLPEVEYPEEEYPDWPEPEYPWP